MRLNYTKLAPEGFQKMLAVLEHVAKSGLEETLIHMTYLRTSQINGCPFCIDQHWRDATKCGVEARKLNAVMIFRDAPFFTDRERAALEWAEAVTYAHKDQALMQKAYDIARAAFSEVELANLAYAITEMNALNRLAIAFHVVPA